MAKTTDRRRPSSAGRATSTARTPATPAGSALTAALACLDELLTARLEQAEREFSPAGALDALRGLHVSAADVRRALRPTDAPAPVGQPASRIADILAGDPAFSRLVALHALDTFQVMTLLVALAPEVDLRYQKLFGYLQDDVTKKRPTVDFVLSLLCAGDAERYSRRAEFAADRVLLSRQIIELVPDPNYVVPPLLAQYVKPDEQIVRFLLGDTGLDSRLAPVCRVVALAECRGEACLPADTRTELDYAVQKSLPLWLHGPDGVGFDAIVAEVAGSQARGLLELDASRTAADIEKLFAIAARESVLRDCLLHVRHAECWNLELRQLPPKLRGLRASVVFSATQPPPAVLSGSIHAIRIPRPASAQRALCWRKELGANGLDHAEPVVTTLARRFHFTAGQISAAAVDAASRPDADPFAAARLQGSEALGTVASRIEVQATWNDIVLTDDAARLLRELCERVDAQDKVLEEWGFAARSARGRGTSALFAGSSGTGKTMAAEVVASSLRLELYRIDLARVVSKYIGETEKNLEKVFTAAEGTGAILLFDEADALFGKRSEVKDAHDRYANIETSYLLQRMEEFDGVAILATNLATHLDDAFTRRLSFYIPFAFPDVEQRRRLWERAWPPAVPRDDIDIDLLARQFRLSGGSIRNVGLASSFLAAAEGEIVRMRHVMHALHREHQKLGTAMANVSHLDRTEMAHVRRA